MQDLAGICVPICTPFDASGEQLDEPALRAHIDSMLEAGVHIILVCGGTGEFPYLRSAERRRIAEIAARQIDRRAGFMVQTSGVSTSETIEACKHAQDLGADGIMVLPPYFEGPERRGVLWHYEQVARAVDLSVMVYNIPQSTTIDITPDLYAKLLEIDNIWAIKDSTGSLIRIQELLAVGGTVFNGADPIAFAALLAGCPGCVWGAVNAMPRQAVQLYERVAAGDLDAAREVWQRMLPAQLFFWSHFYTAAVKAATNLSGRPVGPCRKPVQPLTAEEQQGLLRALQPLGIGR